MVKTIKVSDDTHRRIKSLREDDETMGEAIDRLINEPALLDLYGLYADDKVEEMREAIENADERGRADVEELRDRFE